MNRFHVHVGVDDLQKNIAFYSSMFGKSPAIVHDDYAKWLLDDPAVNFAISTRTGATGVDHLGFQADGAEGLAAMKKHAEAAELELRDDGLTSCCYARSEKHWLTDPQGIAWEHFHSLEDIPVFREEPAEASACCAPQGGKKAINVPVKAGTACC